MCKDLGIRHPEELSLCKPLELAHLKKNYADLPKRKQYIDQNGHLQVAPDTNTFIPTSNGFNGSSNSLDAPHNGTFSCAPAYSSNHTLNRSGGGGGGGGYNGTPITSPTGVSIARIENINRLLTRTPSFHRPGTDPMAITPRSTIHCPVWGRFTKIWHLVRGRPVRRLVHGCSGPRHWWNGPA